MKTKKIILAVCCIAILACLMVGGAAAASEGQAMPQTETALAMIAEEGGEYSEVSDAERFKPYEPFGLTYDAGKNELLYNGKAVRWFEDYYTLPEDGAQAGVDFFNKNGVVDVYAVRDLSDFVRAEDGSYDPGGKLVGVKEFSAEEFAARDIDAIENPPQQEAVTGKAASPEELAAMAKEYEPFGLTYDAKNDQWYFSGEKVRYFQDVLTTNGEDLTGGKWRGTLRSWWNEGGIIDIYTVRDHARPDASGNGTLTGVEKYSQAEFDERTQREAQSSSGFCTVYEDAPTVESTGGSVGWSIYEPYGMRYDEKSGCFTYDGEIVRFFNDPVAGTSFTNYFTGTVDLEAEYRGDTLTGIRECSQEAYERHNGKAALFSGTRSVTAIEEGSQSSPASDDWCKEYEAFGVSYDREKGGWYYDGQRIRMLIDPDRAAVYSTDEDGVCLSVLRDEKSEITELREISEAEAQTLKEKNDPCDIENSAFETGAP